MPVLAAAAILVSPTMAGMSDPDPAQLARGKRIFLYCAACHSLGGGEKDKVGPNLHDVMGAVAGTRGSFGYSTALKESGITWTDDTLDRWLTKPSALVPGTKMAFAGLAKGQDRADLLVYLKQATQP
jgi:cytochrome c